MDRWEVESNQRSGNVFLSCFKYIQGVLSSSPSRVCITEELGGQRTAEPLLQYFSFMITEKKQETLETDRLWHVFRCSPALI